MSRTVCAATLTAFFAASAKLFGDTPTTSITFWTTRHLTGGIARGFSRLPLTRRERGFTALSDMHLYTRIGHARGTDGGSEEEREEDEGTSRLRILVPEGTQEVHEGGQRNPPVPRLAERFRASTNPSSDLGFREPFAIDSPHIPLDLLRRG